jgi:hypothetical protein
MYRAVDLSSRSPNYVFETHRIGWFNYNFVMYKPMSNVTSSTKKAEAVIQNRLDLSLE